MKFDTNYYKHLFVSGEKDDQDFYKEFLTHQFILRDHLAIDRTRLANESTFLAYIRTGLAVAAAGATLMHFSDISFYNFIGGGLLFIGFLIFLFGTNRYNRTKKTISHIRDSKEREEMIRRRKSFNGV